MKKRILIVDDNEADIVLVEDLLALTGCECDIFRANNGLEALEKVRTLNPDLVVLDVMLPKMDGFHVCGLLKCNKKFKNIPVVMLTMKAAYDDMKTGRSVGADVYMCKPLDPDLLCDEITRLTNK